MPSSRPAWVSRDLEVEHLPARLEDRGIRVLGLIAMGFGAFFALLPIGAAAWAFVTEGRSEDVVAGLAVFVLPLGLFAALFVWGYREFVRRTAVTIDRLFVRYEWRTLRGTRTHSEPLAHFAGLRLADWSDSDVGDEYEIVLEHTNPELSVVLYRAHDWTGRAARRMAYGDALGVRLLGRQPGDGER